MKPNCLFLPQHQRCRDCLLFQFDSSLRGMFQRYETQNYFLKKYDRNKNIKKMPFARFFFFFSFVCDTNRHTPCGVYTPAFRTRHTMFVKNVARFSLSLSKKKMFFICVSWLFCLFRCSSLHGLLQSKKKTNLFVFKWN